MMALRLWPTNSRPWSPASAGVDRDVVALVDGEDVGDAALDALGVMPWAVL
jgi:hypothetical protein